MVADESLVAPALVASLQARAEVVEVPMARPGAHWPKPLKPFAFIARSLEAERVASDISEAWPPFDVVHIHWLPNGLVGRQAAVIPPWVLHVHGSDIRGLAGIRARVFPAILRMADAVVYSTPDLAAHIDPWRDDAEHLPTPIPSLDVEGEDRWDVLAASEALEVKGAAVTFAAMRRLAELRPGVRMAAFDGPAFQAGPWERLALTDKATFHRRLASSGVILGQFKLGILSIVECEALALGRPVIAWVDPALYPDPPPVVSVRDPEAIAAAALDALPPPDGAAWVQRHHGPARIADRLLDMYARITR